MKSITARLREPSTYAGLAILGSLFGVKELAALSSPEIVGALAALASILLPERK